MRFIITKDSLPAGGASVALVTKGVIPMMFQKTADETGTVKFNISEVGPNVVGFPSETLFNKIPWLFMAYINGSEYGVWKDQAFFELGKAYNFKLKKYKEAPTFFVKIQLKDIIGAELFSNFVTEVEKIALTSAGLEVVNIKGQGTRTVEVQFKPPWQPGSIVIDWVAVWFILKVLAVAASIIAILVVAKWSFGEIGAGIAGGVGIGILLLVLLASAKKGEIKR